MILRIVKMTFRPEERESFLALFDERRELIRGFEGCTRLELWQEKGNPSVFFTYSWWETEEHLDRYRKSSFFEETWQQTKTKFAARPEAWTVNQLVILE